jgi:hypothetical protein
MTSSTLRAAAPAIAKLTSVGVATLAIALSSSATALLACASSQDETGGSAGSSSVTTSSAGGAGGTSTTTGSGGSAGQGGDGAAGHGGQAGAAPSLCDPVVGDLLGSGDFEAGMDGLAPSQWQVRNPVLPEGDCLTSGTPAEHVFLSSSPCGGNAVAIDARGQWDCYAIQRFSEYNTIEGGATYRIGVVARSQLNAPDGSYCPECGAAWFHVGAQWLDGNDAVFADEKNPHPATAAENNYDWKILAWDLVAPAEARRIVVWLTAHYPGRVDYDRVTVTKVP